MVGLLGALMAVISSGMRSLWMCVHLTFRGSVRCGFV
jgi:hypothetical protein